MNIYKYPDQKIWGKICERPKIPRTDLFPRIQKILQFVKEEGDAALIRYSQQFDGVTLNTICCSPEEINASDRILSETLKSDIRLAISNISRFHASQRAKPEVIETSPGVRCWREARPIEKVGLYVPAGTAPLFSSVLMLGIPAVLAGCSEIVLCSPPRKDGTLHPAILWAAKEIGITTVCKIGGAQAVAAMAYGTKSVPAVYKILGPGNQYVTAAKLLVSTENVAIDMPAGPSEVLVVADAYADPEFIAADLLSQAEHGIDSQVIFVTQNAEILQRVKKETIRKLKYLKRAEIVIKSLEHSKMVLLGDIDRCIDFSNTYAPEHLIIHTRNAQDLIKDVVNAGSVFIGTYTPESAGDYASGTNHTLPTNAFARNYSGVSLDSYVKMLTFQSITPEGLEQLGPIIERMADEEGLDAHKLAVSVRLKKIKKIKETV